MSGYTSVVYMQQLTPRFKKHVSIGHMLGYGERFLWARNPNLIKVECYIGNRRIAVGLKGQHTMTLADIIEEGKKDLIPFAKTSSLHKQDARFTIIDIKADEYEKTKQWAFTAVSTIELKTGYEDEEGEPIRATTFIFKQEATATRNKQVAYIQEKKLFNKQLFMFKKLGKAYFISEDDEEHPF
jgi:hypothetical protein